MTIRTLLILATSVLLILSCSENKKIEGINSLFMKEAQTFKLANDPIEGKEGTIIELNKEDLMFEDGSAVSGPVTIELREFYKKADMLFANISTVSDNGILETGGMIEVNAFSENKKLRLKDDAEMTVKFVAPYEQKDMQTFYGEIENGTVVWNQPKKTVTNGAGILLQSNITAVDTFYVSGNDVEYSVEEAAVAAPEEWHSEFNELISKKLGWINCDRFLEYDALTNITVKCDSANYPLVSLVFSRVNSIMPSFFYRDGNYKFKNIPVGEHVALIAMKKVEDIYYFSETALKIEENMQAEVSFQELSESELTERVEALVK